MNVDEVLDHELIGVDASGERCACGVKAQSLIEHLGEVAVAAMGVKPSKAQRLALDLERTWAVIAERAAEQDALRHEVNELGLTGFIERSEWLIEHRSPLDALAWELRWAGVPVEEPEPKPARRPRKKTFQPTPRQLEIALVVLDKSNAATAAESRAA